MPISALVWVAVTPFYVITVTQEPWEQCLRWKGSQPHADYCVTNNLWRDDQVIKVALFSESVKFTLPKSAFLVQGVEGTIVEEYVADNFLSIE